MAVLCALEVLMLAMRVPGYLLVVGLLMVSGVAQSRQLPEEAFWENLTELRRKDDVENYTYAFIDEYLRHPTEGNLFLFTLYEKKRWRPLASPEEYLAYVVLLCNQGYYLTKYGNVYEAIHAYEKASQLFVREKLTGFDIIEYCLKPLGNNYSMLGDYTSAANIVKGYLYLAEQQKNDAQRIPAYINLSIIYHDTGRQDQAIQLLQQVLVMPRVPPEKKMLMFYNLARNHADLRKFATARQYANRAASIVHKYQWPDAVPTLVNVYALNASIDLADGQFAGALTWVEKAQTLATANNSLFKSRELAKLSNTHASILVACGRYDEALVRYQRTLTRLLPRYDPLKHELPDARSFYAENTIKETLDGMAEVYAKLNDPVKSLACYKLRFDAEDLLRDTYNYDEAKLIQQAESRNVTEKALELLYAQLEESKDGRYAVEAFQFSERTKAMILRENIEDRAWLQRAEQDSLVQAERALRYKQAMLASDIVAEQLKLEQADVDHIHRLVGQQMEMAVVQKEIAQALARKYPQRRVLDSFQSEVIQRVQHLLKFDRATMIEYFFGAHALYIFRIDQHSVQMRKVEVVESLKQNVLALRDFFSDASAINNDVEGYAALALKVAQSRSDS
jgi:tetratricopeptide (TPR) repeat protein